MSDLLKNKKVIFILILALFILIRLPGLNLPYHQDENTWLRNASTALGSSGHPPLGDLIYWSTAKVFGFKHFHYTPFIFSVINLIVLFLFVRFHFGPKEALLATLFFTISFYNVLASIMVDTDGQVLPLFFLLSAFFFYKWQKTAISNRKIIFGVLTLIAMAFGFLTKTSFIIAVGAIILEFLYARRERIFANPRILFKYALGTIGLLGFLAAVLFAARFVYPVFNLEAASSYWKHFFVISGRNYLQISIQFMKALFYVSPLFVASLFFISRKNLEKLRLFLIFLCLGLIFYLVLFDFSSGALDRYFQFIIIPLSIILGVVAADVFSQGILRVSPKVFVLGSLTAAGIFLTQFLPHFVPALYPKTAWFDKVFGLKWNFVFPFTGGSGPAGFYVSWLFISLAWLLTVLLSITSFLKLQWRKAAWTVIFIVGLLYNGVFIEEYLFGKINGNVNFLLKRTTDFVIRNPAIKSVITYNDIGGRELTDAGKRQRRMYVAPKFADTYVNILNSFKSYYMVIEIPRIDPNSIFAKYFKSCNVIYEEFSGKIPARVYDCRSAINL